MIEGEARNEYWEEFSGCSDHGRVVTTKERYSQINEDLTKSSWKTNQQYVSEYWSILKYSNNCIIIEEDKFERVYDSICN